MGCPSLPLPSGGSPGVPATSPRVSVGHLPAPQSGRGSTPSALAVLHTEPTVWWGSSLPSCAPSLAACSSLQWLRLPPRLPGCSAECGSPPDPGVGCCLQAGCCRRERSDGCGQPGRLVPCTPCPILPRPQEGPPLSPGAVAPCCHSLGQDMQKSSSPGPASAENLPAPWAQQFGQWHDTHTPHVTWGLRGAGGWVPARPPETQPLFLPLPPPRSTCPT